ncbi:FixH family protein [Rhodospirillum centenum]|uniref:Nitrogen fixation protein fixH, putative n=1 Tax=Rhodospirillum centenum (strain ATCC 51521 / SW) TaxID=414684 RepID=B6IT11_RHOCS|nr:FixH family protein [Rhodospirillum centenum]ACI98682.1 nitrogen fixation protein fixH, putative [Rhodospirillum centenum SW]
MTTVPTESPRKSAWIPWVFVGGMLIVVVVNAILIVVALKSWTGLVVPKPYERGIHYNEVLEAQSRQDALGWTVKAGFEPIGGPLDGRIVLTVTGRDGAPLSALRVAAARLVRPVEVIPDVPLAFDYVGDGRFVAHAVLPRPGQWDLKATLHNGGDAYVLSERLFAR